MHTVAINAVTPPSARANEALFGRRKPAPEQAWAIDARRVRLKGIVYLAVGLAGVVVIRLLTDWLGDPVGRLVHLAAVAVAGMGVLTIARVLFLECDAGIRMSVLGVCAAVAMGDLGQHVIAFTLMPALAWIVGLLLCLGILADLLDLEIPEAALVAGGIYLAKFILRWTVFSG